MSYASFYHAGCPVCTSVDNMVADAIDSSKFQVESINLAEQANRIGEAEEAGVKTVPALVLNDQVFHINFGASIEDLKNN